MDTSDQDRLLSPAQKTEEGGERGGRRRPGTGRGGGGGPAPGAARAPAGAAATAPASTTMFSPGRGCGGCGGCRGCGGGGSISAAHLRRRSHGPRLRLHATGLCRRPAALPPFPAAVFLRMRACATPPWLACAGARASCHRRALQNEREKREK